MKKTYYRKTSAILRGVLFFMCFLVATGEARTVEELSLTERVTLAIHNTHNPAAPHTPDNVGDIAENIQKDDPDDPKRWIYKYDKAFGETKLRGYCGIRKTRLKAPKKPKGEGWHKTGDIPNVAGLIWFREDPLKNNKFDEIRADCVESGYHLVVGMRRPRGENRDNARKEIAALLETLYHYAETYQVFDRIKVYLVLNKEDEPDEQLTPGDNAVLVLKLENNSPLFMLGAIVNIGMIEDARHDRIVSFPAKPREQWIEVPYKQHIRAGETITFPDKITVQIADEKNPWIQDKLIRGKPGSIAKKEKPSPELSVKYIFHARVKASYTRDVYKEIIDKPIALRKEGEKDPLPLSYPDLFKLAGTPPAASPLESDYHKRGDPQWCHLNHEAIRAVAIRAARYNNFTDDEGNRTGEVYGEFPDNVAEVVANIAAFVREALFPKKAGYPIHLDFDLAKMVLDGTIAPENMDTQITADKHQFICASHSYFFGALVRALGIGVREVNMAENIGFGIPEDGFFSRAMIGKNLRALLQSWNQDAASQVWHKKDDKTDWQFYALWNATKVVTNPQDYLDIVPTYDMWVGISPYTYTGKAVPRFNMWKIRMNLSMYWRFNGWGDSDGWHPGTPETWLHSIKYWIWSPVTAVLTNADGKKIGAPVPIDPKSYLPFMPLQKKPAGLINEIKNAYYFPENAESYPGSEDPESVKKMQQTFIIPVQSIEDRASHTLTLIGTGNGHFMVTGEYVDGKGKPHNLGSYQGEISKGEKITITGSDLRQQPAMPATHHISGQPVPDHTPPGKKPGDWDTVLAPGADGSEGTLPEKNKKNKGGYESVFD